MKPVNRGRRLLPRRSSNVEPLPWRLTRASAILLALPLTTACTSLSVRSPVCEPPPIPAELLQPCPDPVLPTNGTFSEIYLLHMRNTGPWGQCIQMQAQLVATVKYQAQVCPHIRSLNQSEDKAWYQFWK